MTRDEAWAYISSGIASIRNLFAVVRNWQPKGPGAKSNGM